MFTIKKACPLYFKVSCSPCPSLRCFLRPWFSALQIIFFTEYMQNKIFFLIICCNKCCRTISMSVAAPKQSVLRLSGLPLCSLLVLFLAIFRDKRRCIYKIPDIFPLTNQNFFQENANNLPYFFTSTILDLSIWAKFQLVLSTCWYCDIPIFIRGLDTRKETSTKFTGQSVNPSVLQVWKKRQFRVDWNN